MCRQERKVFPSYKLETRDAEAAIFYGKRSQPKNEFPP